MQTHDDGAFSRRNEKERKKFLADVISRIPWTILPPFPPPFWSVLRRDALIVREPFSFLFVAYLNRCLMHGRKGVDS